MAKKITYELYNPHLSVKENATTLGCSEASVRKYIRESGIDRHYDVQYCRWKKVHDYNKEYPESSYRKKSQDLGLSINTIRRYESLSESYMDISIRDIDKVSHFDIKNKNCVKSISYSQDEILLWIMQLYCNSKSFDCDLTYSKGVFYKRVPSPLYKFDKYPQIKGVENLDVADRLPDHQFDSIIYDLPFIISDRNTDSIIKDRFTCFKSAKEAYQVNDEMLDRAIRLLKNDGLLVVKTMDCSYGGKQFWISDYVLQRALKKGLQLVDKFILLSHNRLFKKIRQQRSARKYHSYFFVFRLHIK